MKKIISMVLSFVIILSMSTVAFAANVSNEEIINVSRKDEIIQNYKEKLATIRLQQAEASTMTARTSDLSSAKLDIQAETVEELQSAGYEAYNVNPQTFESVEDALNTDLTSAGLSEDGSYIIMIEGENNSDTGISPMANTSSSFTHTYNGQTYTLRWMTMFVTDDPIFEKYSEVNLLESNARNVIEHFLDSAVDIVVGEVSKRAGIIKTILGLDISDFMVSYDAYMDYNATSTWTRRYTQVWDTYYQTWTNGCCVEEVEAASYINGWYYDVSLNTKNPLIKDFNKQVYYSDYYDDFTWRKDNAVIGYLTSAIRWDVTDDVKYKHDGDVIITHRHNF